MANLIKKIKIKKQDGTFTDYIPIGAEAQNISTNDGDSVQLKLNKKPYYYNSVADMKADTKLKAGDMAITLGYYEPNDGGNGEYRIVSGTYTDDGGSYHKLNNNLFAELIVKNSVINVKTFGTKGINTIDNTSNIVNALAFCHTGKYQCFFPSGEYIISQTLETTGISIKGQNSKNTILKLNNCDGIACKRYSWPQITEISNLSFNVQGAQNYEICGIKTLQMAAASQWTYSYKFTNLHFTGLGCCIELNDAFRINITDIGANQCFRGIFVKNQVVQSRFSNIVMNCDLNINTSSTRYGNDSIGFQVGINGETNRPEGIKLSQICMTGFNIGLYMYDCLYFNATQCEFDLCRKQAALFFAGDGGCTLSHSWLNNTNASDAPTIEIKTSNATTKYDLTIANNIISTTDKTSTKTGIDYGNYTDVQYRWGINIKDNVIENHMGTYKYGININRARTASVSGNWVFGSGTADIKFQGDNGGTLIGNRCGSMDVTVFNDDTLWAYGNIINTITKVISGTLIGDLSTR